MVLAKELRQKTVLELKETLQKIEQELGEKKLLMKVKKDSNLSIFKKMKIEIARIHTVLNEKEVLNGS